MESMRSTWTDERLDDLVANTDTGFDRVDRRFEQIDRRFEQIDRRFAQVDRRFEGVEREISELRSEMNARFDALNRTLIQCGFGLTGSILCLVIAFILTGR